MNHTSRPSSPNDGGQGLDLAYGVNGGSLVVMPRDTADDLAITWQAPRAQTLGELGQQINEDTIASAGRLEQAAEMVELQDVHETERHLLYVALTRARDELWVSAVAPGSEYLEDLM